MNPTAWIKKPTPVFSRTETVYGPGHASFVTSPSGKENWIVYHAAKHSGAGWKRHVCIQPFTWNKDASPNFGKPLPTGEKLPVPK
jgi:GH43 family beta-xylosidase